jgi:hypothetical protein
MLKIFMLLMCFLFEPMISYAAPTVFLNILKEAAADQMVAEGLYL